MLIVSANDACLAASEHVGGDEERFVDLMNAKAAALELRNTHFSNACGFDAPGHYSTAEDLAKLSEIALHHPVFKELVREEREIIMPINEHRAYVLRTTNRLLGRIPGVQGVKTGFTSKAGRCLIAKVSQDGSDLLLVILNSNVGGIPRLASSTTDFDSTTAVPASRNSCCVIRRDAVPSRTFTVHHYAVQ